MIGMPPRITPRTAGIMSTVELATWAQVGRNSVTQLVGRFGIRELTGHAKNHRFSVHEVLRKVLGVTPESPEDLERLLIPLQKTNWVSQVTGMSISAINAGVCEKRSALPPPVELTVTERGRAAARGRRWVPAQIAAHLHGDPIPFLAPRIAQQKTPENPAPAPASNVFAAICNANAEVSRQCLR